MTNLKTTIGLEIHVQLKTKSKMFCRCDNEAFGVKPNTTVCPICLGMPGSLPVANEQAILWTIKTGLTLNCEIPKIAKFDRKHYFYPDLPKGYQISQYDEPFCVGGYVEVGDRKINLTRIHLEEDAGKLIHREGISLVDLNRAGTPLMEIVSEPDIVSPEEAGAFLRKLQKIVRDEVSVSEASMEKGHLRCDANISITDGEKMSEIVELKNLNSFRFVEKALAIEEVRLKEEYPAWPLKLKKVTRGYDSKKNITFAQRTKEEAADYRYFPEPDLPPFDSSSVNLASLKKDIGISEDKNIEELVGMGLSTSNAKILASSPTKEDFFRKISENFDNNELIAKVVIHNYFGFELEKKDLDYSSEYAKAIEAFGSGKINKNILSQIFLEIRNGKKYLDIANGYLEADLNISEVVEGILKNNAKEVNLYKAGKQQLLGFFVGLVMRETKGAANPAEVNRILLEKLGR